MGFDADTISRTIHIRPPRHINDYMQESGRAGRKLQKSEAVLYWEPRDIGNNIDGMTTEMREYCKCDDICLRQQILAFYGYQPSPSVELCRCCSVCVQNCDCQSCVKQQ